MIHTIGIILSQTFKIRYVPLLEITNIPNTIYKLRIKQLHKIQQIK